MADFEIGCQVQTAYGRGNVIEIRDANSIVVELDEWKLAGGTHPLLYSTPSQLKKCSFADIGTCVLTKYGPGIIFNVNRVTGLHTIRLWRPRGMGSATAHMNMCDILHTIKAFPGLEVNTIFGTGVVESYSAYPPGRENGKYIVHLDFGIAYLNESAIVSCPEAKVLPIAESLADKALSKIKWTEWGESVYANASKTPVWSSVTSFWDRLKSGETKIDEALAERARQLNEHVSHHMQQCSNKIFVVHHTPCEYKRNVTLVVSVVVVVRSLLWTSRICTTSCRAEWTRLSASPARSSCCYLKEKTDCCSSLRVPRGGM
jgi:hypothetical protein